MKPITKKESQLQKAEIPDKIHELIQSGIPLHMAVFSKTVRSRMSAELPEFAFYDQGGKHSRTAKMWYTPHGVVTEQNGKYKIIPLANVTDTNVL